MTNKYRTRMDQRELYNVRDLPHVERLVFAPWGEGTYSSVVLLVNQTRWEFISLDEKFFSSDREAIQLCVLGPCSIILNLYINRCLIKA